MVKVEFHTWVAKAHDPQMRNLIRLNAAVEQACEMMKNGLRNHECPNNHKPSQGKITFFVGRDLTVRIEKTDFCCSAYANSIPIKPVL